MAGDVGVLVYVCRELLDSLPFVVGYTYAAGIAVVAAAFGVAEYAVVAAVDSYD